MKFLAASALALMALTSVVTPTFATDMLVVVLEIKGEKSIHYQMSSDCQVFLDEFQKDKKEGAPTFLTLEASPKVTGKVILAYCIRPDGTILGKPPEKKPVVPGRSSFMIR